jgi:hypothetical protein
VGTLATALYATTDDLLKARPDLAPERPAVGITPQLTDAELVTLAMMQAMLGFTSEARWIRHARVHLRHLFPYLPQQSGYNKRLRKAAELLRRVARLLLTDPAHLREDKLLLRDQLTGACSEMTALAASVRDFATLLTPDEANAVALTGWIAQVRAADLPFMHSYATGLERDRAAVDAALTLPWHNGRTEGVNNKIKLIKRQTYGRAGHPLLRQRILLS